MLKRPRLYFAAPFFNLAEISANTLLAAAFEERGWPVYVPQRDAFDFATLQNTVQAMTTSRPADVIVQDLIYLVDIGHFLTRSRAVVANFEEPIDEGVLVEACAARRMRIPVVGWRSDMRSPFGAMREAMGGTHFFASYQCDAWHIFRPAASKASAPERRAGLLADTLTPLLERELERRAGDPVLDEEMRRLKELAARVFDGDGPFGPPDAVRGIVERYEKAAPDLRPACSYSED